MAKMGRIRRTLPGRSEALEIGFGPGHLQGTLNQKGVSIVGLDESRQMTALAHQRLSKAGYPARLVRGDALLLPFEISL